MVRGFDSIRVLHIGTLLRSICCRVKVKLGTFSLSRAELRVEESERKNLYFMEVDHRRSSDPVVPSPPMSVPRRNHRQRPPPPPSSRDTERIIRWQIFGFRLLRLALLVTLAFSIGAAPSPLSTMGTPMPSPTSQHGEATAGERSGTGMGVMATATACEWEWHSECYDQPPPLSYYHQLPAAPASAHHDDDWLVEAASLPSAFPSSPSCGAAVTEEVSAADTASLAAAELNTRTDTDTETGAFHRIHLHLHNIPNFYLCDARCRVRDGLREI